MPAQNIPLPSFSGGLNLRQDPVDINDDEVAEALNVELDRTFGLRTRNGTTKLNTGTTPSGARITSIHNFRQIDGTNTVLLTSAAKIYRYDFGTTLTDISGGLTYPNDAVWSWTTFHNWAIGCNGSDGSGGETSCVAVKSGAVNAVALGGGWAFSRVMSWGSRLWGLDVAAPSTVKWSALGDPEDSTTTGAAGAGAAVIGNNDGGNLTGLFVWNKYLWTPKRDRLYAVVPGAPHTDATQFQFPRLHDSIGVVDGNSVQHVLKDVVFLSDEGILSLSALIGQGGLERAILSDRIPEFQTMDKTGLRVASAINKERNQYWISVPDPNAGGDNITTWVMDYARYPAVAWVKFTGLPVGASLATVIDGGNARLYVGGYPHLYRYADSDVYSDDSASYTRSVRSKAYGLGAPLQKKLWEHIAVEFGIQTDPATTSVSYRLDEDDDRVKTFTYSFASVGGGALWDSSVWGTGTWGGVGSTKRDVRFAVKGSTGKRAQTLQIIVSESTVNQGLSVKRFGVEVNPLPPYRISDNT